MAPDRAAGGRIEFTRRALKELIDLEERVRERIVESLEWLATHPRSKVLDIKKLRSAMEVFRLRVGQYRVVYELRGERMVILAIRVAHRSQA
jgi:mRNA interferase RelE/StbE